MSERPNGLTYAEAGVDIDAGNALVERIKPAAAATDRPGVMAGLGGFGALFDLKAAGYADPVLVAATDGVGTKLRLAIDDRAARHASASTSSRCASTTSSARAPSRCSSSTTSPPASSTSTRPPRVDRGHRRAAAPRPARAGRRRDRRDARHVRRRRLRPRRLRGRRDGARRARCRAASPRATCCSASPRAACTRTASAWCAGSSRPAGLGWDAPAPVRRRRARRRRCWRRRGSTCARRSRRCGAGGAARPRPHHRRRADREPAARAARRASAPRSTSTPGRCRRSSPGSRETAGIADAEMLRTFNCGIGLVAVVAPDRADALAAVLAEAGRDRPRDRPRRRRARACATRGVCEPATRRDPDLGRRLQHARAGARHGRPRRIRPSPASSSPTGPSAGGLARAAALGLPVGQRRPPRLPRRPRRPSRRRWTAPLRASGAEILCLAGFMRVLTPGFIAAWSGRMLNIHPSILPLFPGLDTHARALAAGMAVHGCTVHEVTPRARRRPDPRPGGDPGRAGRHARRRWRRGCCRWSTGSTRRCCAASPPATAAAWRCCSPGGAFSKTAVRKARAAQVRSVDEFLKLCRSWPKT